MIIDSRKSHGALKKTQKQENRNVNIANDVLATYWKVHTHTKYDEKNVRQEKKNRKNKLNYMNKQDDVFPWIWLFTLNQNVNKYIAYTEIVYRGSSRCPVVFVDLECFFILCDKMCQ